MQRDNYARDIFITLIVAIMFLSLWLGMITGIIITKLDQRIHEEQRQNLIEYYNVNLSEEREVPRI